MISTATSVAVVTAAVVVSVTVCSIVQTVRLKKKIDYMLDVLEDGENNFRFGKGSFFNKGINRTLNRLKRLFDKETAEIREAEAYYARMLDNVQTGIIVFNEASLRVIYINSKAREMLSVSEINSMRQLSVIDPALFAAFTSRSGEKLKETISDESSQKSISISFSSDKIKGQDVRIAAFNDISETIEDTESESQHRLIRVLTHEIMNTAAPIASLSEALQNVRGKEELSAGLRAIASSSRNLIKFVESYRNVTTVAEPVRRAFYVRDLMASVMDLTNEAMKQHGVRASFKERQDDILLYADESQISRILINLVRNAIQAGAKHIDITADIETNDSVTIKIANDGAAISPESREQIFVPFFTTKEDGTGIGLSLSRQIMRLHGGNLRLLKSDASSTVFALIFR